MSDDVEVKQTQAKSEVKPVFLADKGRRILPVVTTLQSVYQSPLNTPNRAGDIKSREDALSRLGVDASWFGEEELTGSGGVTSWPEVLKEADNVLALASRKRDASAFKVEADLSKPITSDENARLLGSMSTPEQRTLREDREREKRRVEEEKQREIERARLNEIRRVRREEETKAAQLALEAENLRIKAKVEEAGKMGTTEGQRLAMRIYDPAQRKEVVETMDGVVEANRRGLNKRPVDVVRGQVISEVDSGLHGPIGGLTDGYLGRNYIDSRRKELKKTLGRNPDLEEIEREIQRLIALEGDLDAIRKHEARGSVDIPLDISTFDFDAFTIPRSAQRSYDDALELKKQREAAYKSGFSSVYEQIRAEQSFTDETRPWFIPAPVPKDISVVK